MTPHTTLFLLRRIALPLGLLVPLAGAAAAPVCEARSGEHITPVLELFTSEGCSSCPPADRWLSGLKGQPVVAQAFHVGYWDYIGWVDRFATPAHTVRQRDIAARQGLRTIYTPQWVRNGQDWRDWRRLAQPSTDTARARIVLRPAAGPNLFEAQIDPTDATQRWSAYWSVTEHGHSTRVPSGENAGELLHHDFVVRQYTPVGQYQGPQTLRFAAIAAQPAHPRQINLVVFNPDSGAPLQAVSLSCPMPG